MSRISTGVAFAGALAVLASGPALAQTAKENYSYTAPSGMFSEGTTKWQMYRFMAEDWERTHGTGGVFSNGGLATGSVNRSQPSTVQGSTVTDEQVGQPGRRTTRRTN